MKKKLISLSLAVIFLMIASFSFSQNWDKVKPNILYATDKKGDTTDVKVGIRTANPKNSLDVRGKIFTDSLHVLYQIEIGNSIVIGSMAPVTGNQIYSNSADLLIQSNSSYTYDTHINDYSGNVGIGLQSVAPNNLIQVKDLINFYNLNQYTFLGYQAECNILTIILKKYL